MLVAKICYFAPVVCDLPKDVKIAFSASVFRAFFRKKMIKKTAFFTILAVIAQKLR
jgi:hypothetical protein